MTSSSPGAIGIVQLVGEVDPVLRHLTTRSFPTGRPVLADLGGIDEGLIVRLRDDLIQIMPHGGPRVIQRLLTRLTDAGATLTSPRDVDPLTRYPEASDAHEATMLAALARATSPMAIDLLLDQPRRWRLAGAPTATDRSRSERLARLLHPPTIAVVGPPNAGKSTLTNTLVGRSSAIVTDQAGTTRDYTVTPIDLGGLVVRWIDTPGWRTTDDLIEAAAIELARTVIDESDFIISVAAPGQQWAEVAREPDLRVGTQSDRGVPPAGDLSISAVTGDGIEQLVTTARDRLVPPDDLRHPGPWFIDIAS